MLRKLLAISTTLAVAVSIAAAADTNSAHANLSAADIAAKNVEARGGLQAWRSVQSISWTGKMGVGGNQRATLPVNIQTKGVAKLAFQPRPVEEVQLPFVMELQRPRKVRFELQFNGQTAVQVYDGANGWKVRPYLNRRDVEPFSPEELKKAAMEAELDGPLVDYAAKGTRIELAGLEKVDNRDAYNLKLTFKDGHTMHMWIDARTFLEIKVEGQPRVLDGREHQVEVFYSDFRSVGGLQVPFVLETKVLPLLDPTKRVKEPPVPVEAIKIEKVVINPKIEASLFLKPLVETASNAHPVR